MIKEMKAKHRTVVFLLVTTGALFFGTCATTTIHSGIGYGPKDGGDEDRRFLSKTSGQTDSDEGDCRCDSKRKVRAAVHADPEGEPTSRVKPGEEKPQPTAEVSRREMPPAEVKNDVKVVVEKGPNEARPASTQTDAKPKVREDSYFVVARDGGKESVYDRKAEEPPAESADRKSEEPASTENGSKKGASEDPTGEKFFTETDRDEFDQKGTASWYGRDFDGRPTASGEKFDSRKLTAAHRTLPLGSIILVRNLENRKEVIVRINDRGPFVKGRVLDLSEYASERLGYKERGLTTVGIRVIRPGDVKERGEGVTKAYYDVKREEPGEEVSSRETKAGTEEAVPEDRKLRRIGQDLAPEKKVREVKRDYRPEESIPGYSVQVGVFEKEFNALAAVEGLRKLDVPLRVVRRGSLFVVKAGSFSGKQQAEMLKERLVGLGYRAFVTGP